MSKKSKRIIIGLLVALFVLGAAGASFLYYHLFYPQFDPLQTAYIYIDRDDNADSIFDKIKANGNPNSLTGLKWMAQYRKLGNNIRTGKYAIRPDDNAYNLYNRLTRGFKEPVNLTIGSVRTIDNLSRNISKQLMIDSLEIATLIHDSAFQTSLGYNEATIGSLFIPDTYQVYWDVSAADLMKRMQQEHTKFWNKERREKAEAIGMTPQEVATLASIVEEETNNNEEKPVVAGLYINRLKRGIPLQADPTVKFAMQDFGLRRITNEHLKYVSPYNTYLNAGLPPGPIRIPSKRGLESVLNHASHNYLYMCAKEDFSGTHNFATTLSEHNRNARKYWNALNQRKIFK